MPGKYFFNNLPTDAIFRKYIRELNHVDWSSWLIHDYVLARMRVDKDVQDKLREAAKLAVEKMSYDQKPWNTLFAKMDAQNPEILLQVPQIICEAAEKKFREVAPKEDLPALINGYVDTLASIYSYNRWKGDRVACWISSETIRLCETEDLPQFLCECYACDPFLESFQEDALAGKKRELDVKDTYIEWQLKLADKFLKESKALVAVWDAYNALTAKLGINATWPPTKVIDFDSKTVESVTNLIGNPELFRLYDLATDLNSIDEAKACWYAKNFIERVKQMLPQLTSVEQELAKSSAYVS
jgi:hypothetical protein